MKHDDGATQSGEERILSIDDSGVAQSLYGERNEHLRYLEQVLDVRIGARGSDLHITGSAESVELACDVLLQLAEVIRKGYPLSRSDVGRAVTTLSRDSGTKLDEYMLSSVKLNVPGRRVRPRSVNQKAYVDAINGKDLVFGIGPAGTGKTYLAVAMALSFLLDDRVERLVLCRPAVEAGENLGFLPGTLEEKVNPYLRPLYDALFDMADQQRVQQWVTDGTIEVAPLAYMRGRTLNRSFIILDEAQNTSPQQMKMFLTRIGQGSKTVVTGDITQIDLPHSSQSGLVQAQHILTGIDTIAFQTFTDVDVVRHELVQTIIRAYDRHYRQRHATDAGPQTGEHED